MSKVLFEINASNYPTLLTVIQAIEADSSMRVDVTRNNVFYVTDQMQEDDDAHHCAAITERRCKLIEAALATSDEQVLDDIAFGDEERMEAELRKLAGGGESRFELFTMMLDTFFNYMDSQYEFHKK